MTTPSQSVRRRVRILKRQATSARQFGTFLVKNPDIAKDLARDALPNLLPGRKAAEAPAPADAGPGEAAAPTFVPPAGLAAYARTTGAEADVTTGPATTRRVVEDLSRLPEWMELHAGFRGAPPSGAAVGVRFTQQVRLMGIPADIAWKVEEASETTVALAGTGPMGLTLGLWLSVLPTATGSRIRVDAGVGGDPIAGPMGATVLASVTDSLETSLRRLSDLLAEVVDDPDAGPQGGAAPVQHRASGRLLDPRTPVIVGVGQVVQREPDLETLPDPAAYAAQALRAAAADAGTTALLGQADAVYAVASASWSYRDLAAEVAGRLGTAPTSTVMSARYGGDAGQVLINTAAQAIADGEASVVLVCGAEAGNTLAAAQKAGLDVAWPVQGADVRPDRVIGSEREANNEAESAAGLTVPVYMYALMESALRGTLGDSPEVHQQRITGLWSRLSQIGATNPYAWQPGALAPEELAPNPDNRAVAAPYTKLLCANLQVDLASGLILTSVAAAEAAGVPQEKWVFPQVGAAAYDEWFVSERADLAASPAIRTLGRAALEHTGLKIDDIAHVDLYSCFPVAVQIAARELGLPVDDPARPLSVTGGLTFAGGPGNNYGTHAVATLVQRLREDPTAYGLSTSLGWFVTKHALGLYSATPPERPYRALSPILEPAPSRPVPAQYAGPGVIEAATAQFDRTGAVEHAIVSVLTPAGERVLVRTTQPEICDVVVSGDPLGWAVEVADRSSLTVVRRQRRRRPAPPPMTVLHERRGPVLVVTLNRPERRNAVDLATAELLEHTMDWFEADDSARVAVLTGAQGTFCAGADLKAVSTGQFPMTEKGGPLGITARPLAKPLIAAVEGHALAGGCELALVSDLIVASTASQFGLPEPKRGLVAVAGGVLRLSQRLPRNVAMEMVLTGNPQPATRMAELGLVNRLAEPGQVLDAAVALAGEIIANAPLSVAASKRIVEESPDWVVAEAFDRQAALGMDAILSEDAAEGTLAFVEKRAPVWRGR